RIRSRATDRGVADVDDTPVRADTAVHAVVAGDAILGVQGVVADTAHEYVVPLSAVQRVVAVEPVQCVVAAEAGDDIVAEASAEDVVSSAPRDRVGTLS